MFNPFNWGKKQPTKEEQEAKAAADAEVAARAETVQRHAEGAAAGAALHKQLRTLNTRVEDTLRRLDLLEKKRDEHMAAVAAAAASGSEARKKLHWRNKKRTDDEISSLSSHLAQLEDMRATCEKRITQLQRQQDLEMATAALDKAKVDVEEVENVMEAAKVGVENVADVELVMNSYQLGDEVMDDDEMEAELAKYSQQNAGAAPAKSANPEEDEMAAELAKFAAKQNLNPAEVGKMTEPQTPKVPAGEAVEASETPAPDVEQAELEALKKNMAI